MNIYNIIIYNEYGTLIEDTTSEGENETQALINYLKEQGDILEQGDKITIK